MKLIAKKFNSLRDSYTLGYVRSKKLTKQQLRLKLYQKYPLLDFFKLIQVGFHNRLGAFAPGFLNYYMKKEEMIPGNYYVVITDNTWIFKYKGPYSSYEDTVSCYYYVHSGEFFKNETNLCYYTEVIRLASQAEIRYLESFNPNKTPIYEIY